MKAKFDFDVNPFTAGIKKMGAGLDGIMGRMSGLTGKIASGAGRAMTGLIAKVGVLAASIAGVGSALQAMPEIGQAFGIAKDVFLKNFLWPIRLYVMPMLKKMLDWVRDHRAAFVRWGVVVLNVLKAAGLAVKTVITALWGLVRVVGDAFGRAFKVHFRSFDEFINVLSFKISAIAIYLGMLIAAATERLSPFIDSIASGIGSVVNFFKELFTSWTKANENGDSLQSVLEGVFNIINKLAGFAKSAFSGFFEGFVEPLKGAMTPINSIVDSIEDLLRVLGIGEGDGVRGAFKAFGQWAGSVLMAVLSVISIQIKGIVTEVETLILALKAAFAWMSGDKEKAGEYLSQIGDKWKDFGDSVKTAVSGMLKNVSGIAGAVADIPAVKAAIEFVEGVGGKIKGAASGVAAGVGKDLRGMSVAGGGRETNNTFSIPIQVYGDLPDDVKMRIGAGVGDAVKNSIMSSLSRSRLATGETQN